MSTYKFDLLLRAGPDEKFSEALLPEAPEVGQVIEHGGRHWRVIGYVWGPALAPTNQIVSGLICVEPEEVSLKEQKRAAHVSALLTGWNALLWESLKNCEEQVPQNIIYALNDRYPNTRIRFNITYRELFELFESAK